MTQILLPYIIGLMGWSLATGVCIGTAIQSETRRFQWVATACFFGGWVAYNLITLIHKSGMTP